jgi:hypothetical protein
VTFSQTETGSVCLCVEIISDELKAIVRDRLSAICYGAARASRNSPAYSYKQTLNSFFHRYDTKSSAIKKGMIGELLTHILFLHFSPDFTAASLNFNMEEESIKKGFDLVFHHQQSEEIWLVEVKSGDCGNASSIQKVGSLLSIAKNDLKSNLNSDRETLWHNAIHGASIALKAGKLKEQIEDLLEIYLQDAFLGHSRSENYNALLVAVSYSNGWPFAAGHEVEVKHNFHRDAGDFKALMSVAIQKETYQNVELFLRQEALHG